MSDNLLENANQRIFGAEIPPKLDGQYVRLPEVENQIRQVLTLSAAEFSARLANNDRESEYFLRAETLVCLLCVAHAEDSFHIENLIAERLLLICEKRIRKMLSDKSLDRHFIEEAVRDIYAEMAAQIIRRTEKSYDFWEVRFYKTLTTLTYIYLRKHAAKRRATALFTELSNEDDETDFETRLESGEDLARKIEIRETSRKVLNAMPEDLRKIFILYYRDDETQKTIAAGLHISDRTVRNKLDKINDFLNDWRESPGEK